MRVRARNPKALPTRPAAVGRPRRRSWTWLRGCAWLAAAWLGGPAVQAQPVVSGVTVSQTPGTRSVVVAYVLAHPQSLPCMVVLQASRDNGEYWEPVASVAGDVGAGITSSVSGANKTIVWNAGNDWSAQLFPQVKVRITADDGRAAVPVAMVPIPGGTFTMGDSRQEGYADELPLHTVTVSAFHLQNTETTFGQWKETFDWNQDGNRGYDFAAGQCGAAGVEPYAALPEASANYNQPVTMVSWWDVVKWCNARSRREGLVPCYYADAELSVELKAGTPAAVHVNWAANGYRLPTEAEWEYAARGGLAGKSYPWGDGISGGQANYHLSGDPFGGTTPVGYYNGEQVPAGANMMNGHGLHDMAGNVQEWCWDEYQDYPSSPVTDPRGLPSVFSRVLRGGNWRFAEANVRIAYRGLDSAIRRTNTIGFRPARSTLQ